MTKHFRVLFPVGQGGFAFESIDGFSVVFDCGSVTAPTRVNHYIDTLLAHGITKIDNVIISHFDRDHVNGIEYLMSKIHVCNILLPHIPNNLRMVYDVATHHAVTATYALARNKETNIIEVNEEGTTLHNSCHQPIWEWIIQSMLTNSDFTNLITALRNQGLDFNRLVDDERYGVKNREEINRAFKNAFGYTGPNAKGLIMLSQKVPNVVLDNSWIENDCHYCPHCCHPSSKCHLIDVKVDKTSCLYLGDAVIKGNIVNDLHTFLGNAKADYPLCLMQIPHHGSQYNFTLQLDSEIPSLYYFIHDKSEDRIKKSASLYNKLTQSNQLLMVRDICADLILQKSEMN